MSELNREAIEVEGANVPFFTYTLGEDQIFEFDTSKCGPNGKCNGRIETTGCSKQKSSDDQS
jgi:hypothetical protein